VMPMLPVQSLVPLALFTALFFIASLFVLAALGHFPRAARNDAMKQGFGPALLWTTIVIVALTAAWRFIPWFAALIAGGIAILIAPLALQYISDAFVDGRRGIAIFAAIDLVLALVLLWYMAA